MAEHTCRVCGSWAEGDLCVFCAVDRAESHPTANDENTSDHSRDLRPADLDTQEVRE